MAPLPVNNTPCFEVFYTVVGHQHSALIRTGVISPATLGTLIDALWTSLSPILKATTIDVVTYRPAGSTVSNPVTTGVEGNTYGSGAGTPIYVPAYYDFVGRSSGGRRCRFTVFGASIDGADFRFQAGENVNIDVAQTVIAGAAQAWYAIDGIKPTWYSYVNAGVNAYWQRKVRP